MSQTMPALNPARAELLQMFALDAKIVKGSGFSLYDEEGREYLDFLSQYGAMPFGHNPPQLWEAMMAAQTEQLPSLVQPLIPVEAEKLARRLAEITPGDLSITTFANSGAETVEAAIKLARIRTGRSGILSTKNGFHGKTLGALSATGKPAYQKGFNAPAPGFDYVEYGNLDALRERLDAAWAGIAAFIVEPIQGEGGVVCPPDGYIDDVIDLCRSYGVLVILDEIQTGLGRTGELFACSSGREVPDMLLLAKALGGGMMPIGACIVRPDVWDDRFGRNHSSTFANNNLAARVANATLDMLLEDNQALVRQVADNGAYLHDRLNDLHRRYPEVIAEVRGRGYMAGLEFHAFDARVDSATMAFASLNGGVTPLISSYLFNVEGVLTAPLFNETHVMRLQPTLIAGRAELDRALDALDTVCDIINRRDYYALVRHLVAGTLPEVSEAPRPASDVPAKQVENVDQTGKFAFVIHYTEEEDIFRSDPSFKQFDEAELANWREWVKGFGPGFARKMPTVTSKTGASAEGWLMSVPMLPGDMRGSGRHAAADMIKTAVDMAGEDGVSRVGLGAFTSIVTRGGETATGRGVPITSGNTLTTVSAVKGIKNMAARAKMPLKDAHVVVVGASGAIGRLASLMLSREVGRISLVGNAANPFTPRLLARVANEICDTLLDPDAASPYTPGDFATRIRDMATTLKLAHGSKNIAESLIDGFYGMGDIPAPLDWETPLDRAVEDADIVLVATSADMALIDPLKLRPGTLVCDIARPPNVADADISDNSVMVFDGGLIQPPFALDLGAFQTLPANLCWGCLGETMLLALAQEDKDYSIGSRLSLADADHLAHLAEEHGFEPAAPQWYGRHVTEADIDGFATEVARARQARTSFKDYADSLTHLPAGE